MQDYFGKNSDSLKDKKLFLFDMDGTIYMDNDIFDGTLDLLDYIDSIGGKYVFITNNSSKSVDAYIQKVRNMGIKANELNFYTSTQASAAYLKKNYPDQLVFAMGTKSFLDELGKLGIKYTTEATDKAKVILMGYDNELNYEKLTNICKMLTFYDLPYIATNPDLVCPVSFGYVPDCGSVATIIKNATGKYPIFIGKPEPTMIEFVMDSLGYSKQETVVLGDRIYTDIASGLNAGVCTILVLSGEATLKTLEEESRQPTFVYENVRVLVDDLKR
ncbi:MAG: HAD-IIA family hydrolase [Bacilli bacterium]|nr:HAD-IIA family hydrolase [Bacilli bacterium]